MIRLLTPEELSRKGIRVHNRRHLEFIFNSLTENECHLPQMRRSMIDGFSWASTRHDYIYADFHSGRATVEVLRHAFFDEFTVAAYNSDESKFEEEGLDE